MSGGKIPPKRPFGFGSRSPRFPDSKTGKTPGPGAYNPKKLKKGPSYTFGKAPRFYQKAQTRRDLDSPSDRLFRSLQTYSQKGSQVTWLCQTSLGDGVIRKSLHSKKHPEGKVHSLSHTDFGKWMQSGGKSSPPDGTYSCYEIILKAGIENGLINVSALLVHYNDLNQSICKYMDEVICKDKTKLLSTNPSTRQARPKKGQLILFGDNTRP